MNLKFIIFIKSLQKLNNIITLIVVNLNIADRPLTPAYPLHLILILSAITEIRCKKQVRIFSNPKIMTKTTRNKKSNL